MAEIKPWWYEKTAIPEPVRPGELEKPLEETTPFADVAEYGMDYPGVGVAITLPDFKTAMVKRGWDPEMAENVYKMMPPEVVTDVRGIKRWIASGRLNDWVKQTVMKDWFRNRGDKAIKEVPKSKYITDFGLSPGEKEYFIPDLKTQNVGKMPGRYVKGKYTGNFYEAHTLGTVLGDPTLTHIRKNYPDLYKRLIGVATEKKGSRTARKMSNAFTPQGVVQTAANTLKKWFGETLEGPLFTSRGVYDAERGVSQKVADKMRELIGHVAADMRGLPSNTKKLPKDVVDNVRGLLDKFQTPGSEPFVARELANAERVKVKGMPKTAAEEELDMRGAKYVPTAEATINQRVLKTTGKSFEKIRTPNKEYDDFWTEPTSE